MLGRLRKLIFGISSEETTFRRRGFSETDPDVQQLLEKIGGIFVEGYHAALIYPQPMALATRLSEIEIDFQGFAYEGAAMGLTLLDIITPWGTDRLRNFMNGPGQPHAYIIQIGVGWALARLRRPVEGWLNRLDPVVKWLALDGYGFHEGYFHWPRYIENQMLPDRLSGYGYRGFDQGLGRSLWFVKGADVGRVSATVAAFRPDRQPDLWSGVGLACAYAGGVNQSGLESLIQATGPAYPYLAQGAVFAAKTRSRANNPVAHTELACQIICGMSLEEAAHLFDITREDLPNDGDEPAFEIWRQRIQTRFADEKEIIR